jgi:hypothetical protein
MANQPKTRTRRTLGGGEKTVTRSKYTDAAGTKIRTREVNKEVPSKSGVTAVSKTIKKRKFANGQTSRSKVESVERANSGFDKITSVKDKVSKKGIAGKGRGPLTQSDKYGYIGDSLYAKSLNYKTTKGLQKAVKKGYNKKS